ncbi:hypothetical protein ACFV9D_09800 [Streptomyces sp. NPDC059875]|uniref:hypothetical protein n=1 Tax=unclassified Streptomyces TaxID=2593676 RepID=UPI00364DCA43
MNLRMIGLGAVVVAATLLPLAALAGPAAGPGPGDDAKPKADGGLLPGLGLGAPAGAPTEQPTPPTPPATQPSPSDLPGRASHCGPELTSPDGIEAQTCVLTEGPDTWARTYYRNATGQRLDAVLTLMGPGGRTVQVRCAVAAQDEPGACETPRERARGAASAYSAVAEFAGAGEGGRTPLLLRSGSNAAGAGGS